MMSVDVTRASLVLPSGVAVVVARVRVPPVGARGVRLAVRGECDVHVGLVATCEGHLPLELRVPELNRFAVPSGVEVVFTALQRSGADAVFFLRALCLVE